MFKSAGIVGCLLFLASTMPVLSDAGAIETLRTQCGVQLNLPSSACDCIAERAGDLSDNQQALVVAAVTDDDATAVALRAQMSIEELTQAATFMADSPAICAQGG